MNTLISLLILIIIIGLAFFLLSKLPIEEPFRSVAYVVLVVIFLVILIGHLTGYVGLRL